MFTAALFKTARTWKQPRYPSKDEWIKKLWYIHTMEYYSAIKRKAFEAVLMRWMNLESIIQSEVSQKEKNKYILTAAQHRNNCEDIPHVQGQRNPTNTVGAERGHQRADRMKTTVTEN